MRKQAGAEQCQAQVKLGWGLVKLYLLVRAVVINPLSISFKLGQDWIQFGLAGDFPKLVGVAGSSENKANSALLELELGLSLAI